MLRINKNIPNLITTLRFLLTILFAILLKCLIGARAGTVSLIPLTLIFTVICITDLIDGKIARKLNSVSTAGAVMDVTADLCYILSAFIEMNYMGILPIWFTLAVVLNFVVFQATSYIRKNCDSSINSTFVFDYLGRASAVLFYLIPGIIIVFGGWFQMRWIINLTLYITTLLALLASFKRCIDCITAVNIAGRKAL